MGDRADLGEDPRRQGVIAELGALAARLAEPAELGPDARLGGELRGFALVTAAELDVLGGELRPAALGDDERYAGIATAMAHRLGNGRLAIVPEAGHAVHLENTVPFWSLVCAFLDEHRDRIVEAAKKYGKTTAMLVNSYEQALQWKAAGAQLLAYSSDVGVLLDGFKKAIAAFKGSPA